MDSLLKYHRVYASINLDAIYNNLISLKNNTSTNTEIIAVIKADGYGHGAVPIAYAIEDKVLAFAVATVQEATNLKKHGIKKPVYIIGFTHESQIEDILKYDLRPTVFSYSYAKYLSEKALDAGKKIKIHIKLDTGMGRIGYQTDEKSFEEILLMKDLKGIETEGIFSHFASSDSSDKSFAKVQYKKYMDFVNLLEEKGMKFNIKHTSNSAAIIDMPYANLSAVRAGISLYGQYPSDEVDKTKVILEPALELKSHIVYLKELNEGSTISYGSTFITTKKTKVATIPVGYGDGYLRNLSNKGYVLINGEKAPIIGRVCMDQFMVDVTDIDSVKEGDEVTLIGRDGNNFISVDELSELAGTFNYEFLCDLGKRIPRVFYKDSKIVCTKDYFDDEYIVHNWL